MRASLIAGARLLKVITETTKNTLTATSISRSVKPRIRRADSAWGEAGAGLPFIVRNGVITPPQPPPFSGDESDAFNRRTEGGKGGSPPQETCERAALTLIVRRGSGSVKVLKSRWEALFLRNVICAGNSGHFGETKRRENAKGLVFIRPAPAPFPFQTLWRDGVWAARKSTNEDQNALPNRWSTSEAGVPGNGSPEHRCHTVHNHRGCGERAPVRLPRNCLAVSASVP